MDLRLIVITDADAAAPRDPVDVVRAALRAGAPAVQLRDKRATPRALAIEHDALLFVNDRMDVALAADADGVHLGPDDVPLVAARRAAPAAFLIGYSTDDPEEAALAAAAGADYIGCGAVFGTESKRDAHGERIGVDRLDAVARAVDVPVVGIGGITVENVDRVAATSAAGTAVIRGVMAAPDPGRAVERLLAPFSS
ncbi:MAG: thiamine phosphate synthase [Gemmatimonadota bacterium]